MKRLTYIYILILASGAAGAIWLSRDITTLGFTAGMAFVVLLGIVLHLLPMISCSCGLQRGRKSMTRLQKGDHDKDAVWENLIVKEQMFRQKKLKKAYAEYCRRVRLQRKNGQVMNDIETVLSDRTLDLWCWSGFGRSLPLILLGFGILGTLTVILTTGELSGNALYLAAVGLAIAVLFRFFRELLHDMMQRELQRFQSQFHRFVIPPVEEQERFRNRRDAHKIESLLEQIRREQAVGAKAQGGAAPMTGTEQSTMDQIVEGLRNGEFTFYLQPRYQLQTKRITGAEALVRWNHKDLGLVSPSAFIPTLEQNGYITKLDQYVWESVFAQLRRWIDQGHRPVPIALNITKTDILAMDVAEFLAGMLEKYRIPPRYIDIDIAESAYIQSRNLVLDIEGRLLAAGFRVIVDDFSGDFLALNANGGTQAAVINWNLLTVPQEQMEEQAKALIGKAQDMNAAIFAEGIESMEQLSILRRCGCQEGQGFCLSKPLKIQEFEQELFSRQ